MQQQVENIMNVSKTSNNSSKHFSRLQNLKQVQERLVEEIYSDDQEQHKFKETVQELYLRYQIRKAQIGGNKLDLLIVIHRILFPGQVPEKIEAQRKWFIKYYEQGTHINIQNDTFCPRIDAGLCQKPGEFYTKQLLVYGIDLLQTHDIINRFFIQNPKVSWVNASHCLLSFQNQQLVNQFFQNQCIYSQDFQNHPNRNWIQIRGYKFLNEFERKIYARYYTQIDKEQIATLQKNDQIYQNFRRVNKELEFNLLKNEKIRKMFEQVISEDVISKMIGPNSFRKKKKSTIEKMYGDRSNFIQHPKQHRNPKENNGYRNNQYNHSKSPNYRQHLQNQQYRYSLDYYKKHFIPGLKNNKEKQMRANQKRKDPINYQRLEPIDLQSKMLKKKNKPNEQQNISKMLTGLFEAPLFDETEIVVPDQRPQEVVQPQMYQNLDTSFHFDQAPPPAQNKCELQKLLDRVDSHQKEQYQQTVQIANQKVIVEHNHHQNNINNSNVNLFNRPYNRNYDNFWTNKNVSTNFPSFDNKSSNSASFGDLNSRFNKFAPFASPNPSSIQEKSQHQMNISYNSEILSSNSLSRHNFSSFNSKQKMEKANRIRQNAQNSNRESSSSGLYSQWAESIPSKEKSVGQGLFAPPSEHSQSDAVSNITNIPFGNNFQGVKRQHMPLKTNNYRSFRSNNLSTMKPAPVSIPEVQTDLFGDNQKIEHFQAGFKNGMTDFKFQHGYPHN